MYFFLRSFILLLIVQLFFFSIHFIEFQLQFLIKTHNIQNICEMLNEFLKVNFTVTIEISAKCHCNNLMSLQFHIAFDHAGAIFTKIESTILISVVFFESSEEFNWVEVFASVVFCVLYETHFQNLLLLYHSFKRKRFSNIFCSNWNPLVVVKNSIRVRVRKTQDDINLKWC